MWPDHSLVECPYYEGTARPNGNQANGHNSAASLLVSSSPASASASASEPPPLLDFDPFADDDDSFLEDVLDATQGTLSSQGGGGSLSPLFPEEPRPEQQQHSLPPSQMVNPYRRPLQREPEPPRKRPALNINSVQTAPVIHLRCADVVDHLQEISHACPWCWTLSGRVEEHSCFHCKKHNKALWPRGATCFRCFGGGHLQSGCKVLPRKKCGSERSMSCFKCLFPAYIHEDGTVGRRCPFSPDNNFADSVCHILSNHQRSRLLEMARMANISTPVPTDADEFARWTYTSEFSKKNPTNAARIVEQMFMQYSSS